MCEGRNWEFTNISRIVIDSKTASFLQSMDFHLDQITLRPKEFFRTNDIEVLTETQVRRTTFALYSHTWLGQIASTETLPNAATKPSLCNRILI